MTITPTHDGALIANTDATGVTLWTTSVHPEGWELAETIAELPLDLGDDAEEDDVLDAADTALEKAGYETHGGQVLAGDWDADADQWWALARRLDA